MPSENHCLDFGPYIVLLPPFYSLFRIPRLFRILLLLLFPSHLNTHIFIHFLKDYGETVSLHLISPS